MIDEAQSLEHRDRERAHQRATGVLYGAAQRPDHPRHAKSLRSSR
jgi:hypothetical protein